MPKTPDRHCVAPGETIAERVRNASRRGCVVPLAEAWPGTADEFAAWKQSQRAVDVSDIRLIGERGGVYLYSELHMTRSYAEAAARAACEDVCHAIAQTVRNDSRLYPRPTPIHIFENPPFRFSKDILDRALRDIRDASDYADIGFVRCSSGALYLFSSLHMNRQQAESLAEWFSVGHLQNP